VFCTVTDEIKANKEQTFFSLISGLLMYLLINSLVDMVCYSFALSASIILTLSICLILVTGAIILKFQIHALKFFSLLVPSGCPLGLLPLLVLIEFISRLALFTKQIIYKDVFNSTYVLWFI